MNEYRSLEMRWCCTGECVGVVKQVDEGRMAGVGGCGHEVVQKAAGCYGCALVDGLQAADRLSMLLQGTAGSQLQAPGGCVPRIAHAAGHHLAARCLSLRHVLQDPPALLWR